MSSAQKFVVDALKLADIEINGSRPWDVRVPPARLEDLCRRVLRGGSLAAGEAYMDGWWEVERLDEFFDRFLRAPHLEQQFSVPWRVWIEYLKEVLTNSQRGAHAFEIGERHYDIGNDLYTAMLDPRMVYSCGYWRQAHALDEAQEAKLDLVCQKIGLQKGMRVLDIGCGWGSFAKFAAERYGVHVVGITVSKEQLEFGKKCCAGLSVELRLQEYREIRESFDRIVSIGMFEHVGYKNYRTYMQVVARCLAEDGLFLLHTIGGHTSLKINDPWIEKYIFPNSLLPSVKRIASAIEGIFVLEDWHNFGADYDKTLLAWFHNFDAHWPELREKYGDRFYRMWKYYLLMIAGTMRARKNHLWQIVLSKKGVVGGYLSIR